MKRLTDRKKGSYSHTNSAGGGYCMVGNIYSEQKCPVCGGGMVHDERRGGVFCVEHPKIAASGRFIVQFGRKVRRRFSDYEGAKRLLWRIRIEEDEGGVDPRDHAASKPLALSVAMPAWLERRRDDVMRGRLSKGTLKPYAPAVKRAVAFFGERSVKTIKYADFEDFFNHLMDSGYSQKTADNDVKTVKTFFRDLLRREVISLYDMPVFPSFRVDSPKRSVVDLETQQAILDEMKECEDPKVWFACSLLARHPNIRPGELLKMREGDIDLRYGKIDITEERTKTRTLTTIYLLDDEIEYLSSLPVGLPNVKFFRHSTTAGNIKIGSEMGDKLWNRAWCRAAEKLGVKGVTLYPGTKHSTATAVCNAAGREAAIAMTGHKTNKAFERYFIASREGELRVISMRDQVLAEAVRNHGSGVVAFGNTSGTRNKRT